MANIIKPKRSESTGQTPTLEAGEMAVNIADKFLWVADSNGTPVLIANGNGSIPTNGTTGQVLTYNNSNQLAWVDSDGGTW